MFFLFLNCNVSLPFSHTFFLWIVDTDKRMKLIFRMPVDLKYFSIFVGSVMDFMVAHTQEDINQVCQ